MMRLALTILILALVACGGSDDKAPKSGSDTAATAEKSAAAPGASAPTGGGSATPEAPAGTLAGSEESQSCLSLVAEAKFQDALPVCMAALRLDPANTEVQNALATAKKETANAAAAGAAADAAASGAVDGAAGAAKSGLSDATGGVLGGAASE